MSYSDVFARSVALEKGVGARLEALFASVIPFKFAEVRKYKGRMRNVKNKVVNQILKRKLNRWQEASVR